MSFPEYSDYECSGFDWLGLIPRHWRTDKFRYVFTESNEKIENEVVGEMLSVSGYRGIEIKIYDDENKRRTEEELQGYRIVRPGQLVVNTMWLNYAGLGVSNYEGHVSPAYRSYWINADVDLRFIHHLMRSSIYVQGYTQLLTGIRPNSLQMSRDDLMGFPVVLAPRAEQTQIARFLDHETAKIDALIREQERLIELLQEKRQAVISHAVTKGLDPDVPMKDSGVEWLGEVPAHWVISRIKNVCIKVTDGAHISPETENGQYAFVSTRDVSDGIIDLDNCLRTSTSSYEYLVRTGCRPVAGDVLFSKDGTIGETAVVPVGQDFVIASSLIILRPAIDRIFPEFLELALQSDNTIEQAESFVKGAALRRLSIQNILRIWMSTPPLHEQEEIVEYLQKAVAEIQGLTSAAEELVGLLRERRSALISAAVTGKIDVRRWQPPADESAFDEEVRQSEMETTA